MSGSDPVDNPPYVPPLGYADAPPPVPPEPDPDPETQAYLDAHAAPPDPRDPGGVGADAPAEDYQSQFSKPPDPRDPPTSELTPGDLNPPSTAVDLVPPVNVDIPHLTQDGAVLTCTMGNWEGEPTTYAYTWVADGLEVGPGDPDYDLVAGDVGKAYVCVVTATNPAGSTEAPASNEVVVEDFS